MWRGLCTKTAAGVLWFVIQAHPASSAAPDVVASILPIHSLVAGVMKGVGEPVLLIPGGTSPHNYALRPSDARALERATVVFWVGPQMEPFLGRPMTSLAGDAQSVALAELPGMHLLPARDGRGWGLHEPRQAQPLRPEMADSHIWLDPTNAKTMVAAIVATLSAADPDNAARYGANGEGLRARLAALDLLLGQMLEPIRKQPYIVFHDGYQYLEVHYGLNHAGAITISPDRLPSAQRLREIRRRVEASGASCVFREPQFEPALIETVVAGTRARVAVLDPLGADLPPGPDAYFTLMERLATSLVDCLIKTG